MTPKPKEPKKGGGKGIAPRLRALMLNKPGRNAMTSQVASPFHMSEFDDLANRHVFEWPESDTLANRHFCHLSGIRSPRKPLFRSFMSESDALAN